MTRTTKKHPTQGDVPTAPNDPLEPVNGADAPMPTMENQAYLFKPGSGTTILDIKEVVLMTLLQLSGGPEVQPGALRHQLLSGERFGQLSPEAQRWFQPVATGQPEA